MQNKLEGLKLYYVNVSYGFPVAAKSEHDANTFAKLLLETESPEDTGFYKAAYIASKVNDISSLPQFFRTGLIYNTADAELSAVDILTNQVNDEKKRDVKERVLNLLSWAKEQNINLTKEELIKLINSVPGSILAG